MPISTRYHAQQLGITHASLYQPMFSWFWAPPSNGNGLQGLSINSHRKVFLGGHSLRKKGREKLKKKSGHGWKKEKKSQCKSFFFRLVGYWRIATKKGKFSLGGDCKRGCRDLEETGRRGLYFSLSGNSTFR